MEGEEEEGKQKKNNNINHHNNNNNISNSEKQEEAEEKKKKKSTDQKMDEECECSPLQSPLHSLDDDDDNDNKPSSSPPLKKDKPFFHRPLPQLHRQPHPQPQQQQQRRPPPSLDPQPQQQQQQQQRQPPPPLDPQPQRRQPPTPLNPQPQRQPPPPLNPHQSTAISIMNPHQSTAMVSVDPKSYRFSPVRSPPLEKMNLPHTVPPPPGIPPPPSETVTVKPQSPVFVVNRPIREELSSVSKMDGDQRQGINGDVEDGGGGGINRKQRTLPSVLSRQRKEDMVKRAALGFRLCAVVFCLVSFSVMAADKTQGWAGDSFDRYKEYRYCISVTIIGFVYAGFQAYDLAYNLISEKHIIPCYIRHYFDFSMDQILTYLLISASSSAATRVDDWQTNWGKDEFTEMASASVGMSFMAFVAFAFSSLISGYNLCMRNYNN